MVLERKRVEITERNYESQRGQGKGHDALCDARLRASARVCVCCLFVLVPENVVIITHKPDHQSVPQPPRGSLGQVLSLILTQLCSKPLASVYSGISS